MKPSIVLIFVNCTYVRMLCGDLFGRNAADRSFASTCQRDSNLTVNVSVVRFIGRIPYDLQTDPPHFSFRREVPRNHIIPECTTPSTTSDRLPSYTHNLSGFDTHGLASILLEAISAFERAVHWYRSHHSTPETRGRQKSVDFLCHVGFYTMEKDNAMYRLGFF